MNMESICGTGERAKREACPIPDTVNDDHFTWWFDEFMATSKGVDSMSTYEIAQAAWNEAVMRVRKAQEVRNG